MQGSDRFLPAEDQGIAGTFAERVKAARLRAGLTQQQLVDRLANEAQLPLDTSAVTRIEAGQREPRLSEALAIARVLGFGLDNLHPGADLTFYLKDIDRYMKESRAALVNMIRSVDPVIDFVKRNPSSLGDSSLENLLRSQIAKFLDEFASDNIAVSRSRTDERLKRQLLRAVCEEVLVRADELPPAHEKWFKEKLDQPGGAPQSGGQSGGWRLESPAGADEWQRFLSQLQKYVDEHGNTRVPRTHRTPDGERLGAWVADQHDQYERNSLEPEKAMLLERIPGWTWRPRSARSNPRSKIARST